MWTSGGKICTPKGTINYYYVSLGPLGMPAVQHSREIAAILGTDGGDILDYGYRHDRETVIAWAFLGIEARDCPASRACLGHGPIGGL